MVRDIHETHASCSCTNDRPGDVVCSRDCDDPSHRITELCYAACVAAKWRRGDAGWSPRLEYRLVSDEDQPAVHAAAARICVGHISLGPDVLVCPIAVR